MWNEKCEMRNELFGKAERQVLSAELEGAEVLVNEEFGMRNGEWGMKVLSYECWVLSCELGFGAVS